MNPTYKALIDDAMGRTPKKSSIPLATDGALKRKPLAEVVDLTMFDGGGNLTEDFVYRLKKPFVRVARLVVLHTWEGTTLNYDLFGAGAGGAGDILNTGFQISSGRRENEEPLLDEPIQATKDYMKYAFDTDVVIDTAGLTKKCYFTSRITFAKFMGNLEGIDLSNNCLLVDGPLSGENGISEHGTDFKWCFEGWGWDI